MLYYGADYYPEQETPEDFEADIATMKEIGFNVVRIGEFAWSVLEPEEGRYTMRWLADTVNQLGKNGIMTLVCTPSACPPAWMIEKHPDILYVDNRGVTRPFGGRRHYCYNNDTYRQYCERITEKIVEALGDNPYVVGFHIDNELAQESTGRCHCPVCRDKFHRWLEKRFGTIERFNQAAGTVFWSQTYAAFNQVNLPVNTIEGGASGSIALFAENPTVRLEFERFCSESNVDFASCQVKVIRRHSGKPVTTNTTGLGTNSINYYDLFKNMDVVAVDDYPPTRATDLYSTSFSYAFCRGVKGTGNFWLAETISAGSVSVWGGQSLQHPLPGMLELLAYYSFVSGSALTTYFQFKSFRYGAEQLETAVMAVDGIKRRRFYEFQRAAAKIKAAEDELTGSELRNEVAVGFDYDTLWALNIKPYIQSFHYVGHLTDLYRELNMLGVGADVIPFDGSAFRKYSMVVLGTPFMIAEECRQALKDYVADGGIVVSTYLSSIKNAHNSADRVCTPAGLDDLFGVVLDEAEPVTPEYPSHTVFSADGLSFRAANRTWMESLNLCGASVIGRFGDTFREGQATVTVNQYGKGRAYYIGVGLDAPDLRRLMEWIVRENGVSSVPIECTAGVEILTRHSLENDGRTYYVFNFNDTPVELRLKRALQSASKESVAGRITVGPKECYQLYESSDNPCFGRE